MVIRNFEGLGGLKGKESIMKLNWHSRGGRVGGGRMFNLKHHPRGEHGSFLEPNIII